MLKASANCSVESQLGGLDEFKSTLLPTESHARILFIGDILGRPGRKIVKSVLPDLKKKLDINFVIANAENLAGGFGVTEKTVLEIEQAGINAFTLGNHWNDKPDIHKFKHKNSKFIFPQNLLHRPHGELFKEFTIPNTNKKILILNLLGMFAMKVDYNNPFEFLAAHKNFFLERMAGKECIIVCDVHAEANSEKQVIGWFLDGIAACVVGTHTHTPTSDERILPHGTAFLSDLGMTGPYNSIIGMDVERTMRRYFPPVQTGPHEVAGGASWFCGFLVEINLVTNLAVKAHRVQYREENNKWLINSVSQ